MSEFDVKRIRTKIGLTQKELAEKIGITQRAVQKMGHSSTRITRSTYAKLLDDTVGREMEKAEEKENIRGTKSFYLLLRLRMLSSNSVPMDCASSKMERMSASMVISSSPQPTGRNGSGLASSVDRLGYAARLRTACDMWMRASRISSERVAYPPRLATASRSMKSGCDILHDTLTVLLSRLLISS